MAPILKNRKERRITRSINRRLPFVVNDLSRFGFPKLRSGIFSNPKCYAKILGNCDQKLSREHFISENILERFEAISTDGIPWLKNCPNKLITPNSLASKCLCEYHNNFLSPLDQFAGKCFDSFLTFGTGQREKVLIPGNLLEQYMLKMLFGVLATHKISQNGINFDFSSIDPKWIRVLFGESPIPKGCGLYALHLLGTKLKFSKQIELAPMFLENKIIGLYAKLSGFVFHFSLVPKEFAFKENHPLYQKIMYRPRCFNWSEDYPKEIRFNWY